MHALWAPCKEGVTGRWLCLKRWRTQTVGCVGLGEDSRNHHIPPCTVVHLTSATDGFAKICTFFAGRALCLQGRHRAKNVESHPVEVLEQWAPHQTACEWGATAGRLGDAPFDLRTQLQLEATNTQKQQHFQWGPRHWDTGAFFSLHVGDPGCSTCSEKN